MAELIEQTSRQSLAEMGEDPCLICDVGWCNTSSNESEFCHDSCEIRKIYHSTLSKEPLCGEHLKEAKEVLKESYPIFENLLIRFKKAWQILGNN